MYKLVGQDIKRQLKIIEDNLDVLEANFDGLEDSQRKAELTLIIALIRDKLAEAYKPDLDVAMTLLQALHDLELTIDNERETRHN